MPPSFEKEGLTSKKSDLIKGIALVITSAIAIFTTCDNILVRKSRNALELKVNYSNYMDKAWDVHSFFKDESQEIDKDIGSQTDSLLNKNIGLTLLFHEIDNLNQLWETRHLRLIEKAGDKIRAYKQVVDSSFKATKEIRRTISFLVPPAARAKEACIQKGMELDRIAGKKLLGAFVLSPPDGTTIIVNSSGKTVVIQTHRIEELLKNRKNRRDSLGILVGEFHLISTNTIDTLQNAWLTH